jgi:hypothetical protein
MAVGAGALMDGACEAAPALAPATALSRIDLRVLMDWPKPPQSPLVMACWALLR